MVEFGQDVVRFHLDTLLLRLTPQQAFEYQPIGEVPARPADKLEPDERARILDEILVILAGAGVPTPEQTYKQDGGFALALSDIRRALAERTVALQQAGAFRTALNAANDVCRSMHAIVERQGVQTNWEGFGVKLQAALLQQHALLYPKTEETTV
jgi:hypothetical protein